MRRRPLSSTNRSIHLGSAPTSEVRLAEPRIDTVLITGGETDMCVLSTVLGAIDWGYQTILVTDCLCSASDEAHDAMLNLFSNRYSQHVETAALEEVLEVLS